jgi:hypothetical protein
MASPVSNDLRFIVEDVSGPWSALIDLGVEIRRHTAGREILFPDGNGWEQTSNLETTLPGYRVVEIQNSTGKKVQLYYPVLAGGLQIPAVAGSFRII